MPAGRQGKRRPREPVLRARVADYLPDAAKDPRIKAAFADVQAGKTNPHEEDAVIAAEARHLRDQSSKLDSADRVVGF